MMSRLLFVFIAAFRTVALAPALGQTKPDKDMIERVWSEQTNAISPSRFSILNQERNWPAYLPLSKVLHGVVVSPDNAYSFVTVEGIGSEPGTVEAIDLRALKRFAPVDVRQQAFGIDFLQTESPK